MSTFKNIQAVFKIPFRSKVIVEMVKGHISTHFLSDYGSWI